MTLGRTIEIAALVAAPCLIALVLWRVSFQLPEPSLIVIVLTIGYALADLVAGSIHWFADEIANAAWPWIGAHFVLPFRAHHVDPTDITRHGFVETNGNNAAFCLVPLAALAWLAPHAPTPTLGGLALVMGVALTNTFHRWAHLARPPWYARFLQHTRLVIRPHDHAQHHATHDRAYCVTNGWTSGVLDALVGVP